MNRISIKIGVAAVIAIVALFAYLFISIQQAHANPESFLRSSTSATDNTVTATTSPTLQSPGRATSTIVLNGTRGNSFGMKNVALHLYRNASSTALSKTLINFQFSPNCTATSPDWYDYMATSTGNVTSGTSGLTWNFASTSFNGNGPPTDSDAITIQLGNVPDNCVRAVLSNPIGSASTSIWGMLVGKKEVN